MRHPNQMTVTERIQWAANLVADREAGKRTLSDPQNNPGNVLHDLLKTRYAVTIASCKCREWIDRMNLWGVAGCREHLEEIVAHLFEEASTNANVSTAVRMALKVPIVGKLEGKRQLRNLVTEAINMAQTAPTRNTPIEELAVRLVTPAHNWPNGWRDWPNVIEFHRDLVQRCLSNLKSSVSDTKAEGPLRAILIPAGGFCRNYDKSNPQPYFWCAYAAAYTLRAVGCTLPIEFWFLPGEMEQVEWCELHARRVAASCHVVDTTHIRCVHGWQVKINAILQSQYDQVLHIDADNIVTRDPSFLFDCSEFEDNAALFWSDNPHIDDFHGFINAKQWERLGAARRDRIQDIEAGQMLIDKRRGARALQLVKHLADHADYWGGFNGGAPGVWYGDKTDFHIGFKLTETPHWISPGFKWNGGGFYEHKAPDGELLFQHACHRKGHLVNGHRIQNLIGNDWIYEAAQFRSPLEWPDGTVEDARRLISPEKHFALPDDRGMSRTVWLDVLARNEYRLPPRFQASDTILDIGANSGAFSYACLRRGAGRVVACEPFPDSAFRCRRNCRPADIDGSRFDLRDVAVWRSDISTEMLELHPHDTADRTTSYSVTLSQSDRLAWQVPAVSLDSLLIELGSVHLLKLDCEGSEFPILYTSRELHRCEHIIGEYHQDAQPSLGGEPPENGWPDWTLDRMCEFLRCHGFDVHRIEENSKVHGGFWASRSAKKGI